MRKRGKYGLNNTIYTNKIGSFLPFTILGSEVLLLSCSPGELHPQLQDPGKLPNSLSFDDAGRWTLGAWEAPGAPGVP